MNKDEEHDALWDLLGQAREPKVSPYFARDVLRTVRQDQAASRHWSWPTLLRWALPVSGVAALLVGWMALEWSQDQQEQKEFAATFDAAAELSSLVAVDNTAPWMDVN